MLRNIAAVAGTRRVAGFILAGVLLILAIRFHLLLRALARTVLLALLRLALLVGLICLIALILLVGVLILILLVHNDFLKW